MVPLNSSDHWIIRVDAITNVVLDKNNLTVYEQFNDASQHNILHENELATNAACEKINDDHLQKNKKTY